MEDNEALDRIDEMRDLVNANLESIIAEQSAIFGEVAEVSGQVVLAGGKRIRPIMVMLAYDLADGDDFDEVIPFAMSNEFIHTASLVHDDINDESLTRRGQATIHAKYGQAKAIIAGDWLFSQGFGLGGRYDKSVVDVMAHYCSKLASAEFTQIDHILDLSTSPEDYLEIVRGKTAGPFAAGCKGAGLIANASEEACEKLFEFGMQIGIAFQLVDDLLDIRGDERMGKPRGSDIYEGKMTLPIIHALTILHGNQRVRLAEILHNFEDSFFDELITLLNFGDSLSYTEILIQNHLERAMQNLDFFPDCDAKQLLKHLVGLIKNRHK
ncbi:MAG TPA: polyprenyl synthetase family protein [Candidatus Poseidoniales archaeon]|nr:MAG TPA: polyprenyl synthetase family protein [Candidatus Poseidoniales archaeon]HIH57905.1 polyprenyl synthetase family protein [Candidatus Poseidoniaceae archaeon]|tara:strand:+ start:2561 stop:3535 length:975 start_codon:yes stop_codon:yes gene_type:complete